MGRLRHWVRRLEYASRQEGFTIPQKDGSLKSFSGEELREAYICAVEAATLGTPQDHPLLEAMRNSADPHWRDVFQDLLEAPPVESAKDLSEPAH